MLSKVGSPSPLIRSYCITRWDTREGPAAREGPAVSSLHHSKCREPLNSVCWRPSASLGHRGGPRQVFTQGKAWRPRSLPSPQHTQAASMGLGLLRDSPGSQAQKRSLGVSRK